MTEITINSDKHYCLYCRKPLQNDSSNLNNCEFHIECQKLMKIFNTDEFSPFSLYDDFSLVKDFFNDLVNDVPNNGGLKFIDFLQDCCFWDNDGHLIRLKIFGGFLQKIPPSIGNFHNLISLVIHNNRYISLPVALADVQTLEHVELHFNSYYNQNYPIPEIIFQNKLVKKLSLSGYFSSISAPFDSLPLLEELRLDIYRDEKSYLDFPDSLISCYNLQQLQVNTKYLNLNDEKYNKLSLLTELDLSSNNLGKLPSTLGELPVLQKLSLVSNRFKQIPQCLMNLSCLQELDLSMNMIQKVPDFINKFSSLEQLILTDNPIKDKSTTNLNINIFF